MGGAAAEAAMWVIGARSLGTVFGFGSGGPGWGDVHMNGVAFPVVSGGRVLQQQARGLVHTSWSLAAFNGFYEAHCQEWCRTARTESQPRMMHTRAHHAHELPCHVCSVAGHCVHPPLVAAVLTYLPTTPWKQELDDDTSQDADSELAAAAAGAGAGGGGGRSGAAGVAAGQARMDRLLQVGRISRGPKWLEPARFR